MTIKIITWIKTNRELDQNGNNFSFVIEPFDYKGQRISAIEVAGGKKDHYRRYLPDITQGDHSARVEINLQENEIERVRRGDWGDFLVIKGNVDIKKWEGSNELRFKRTGMEDSRDGILRLKIEEKGLVAGSFTPKINYIEMPFDKNRLGEYDLYLNNGEHRDKEVIISNIEWEAHGGGEAVELNNGKLKLNAKWPQRSAMPKIKVVDESKNLPHLDDKQASAQEAARKKVSAAVSRASTVYEKLRKGNYADKRQEDFREAVQAISELMKIAKSSSEVEKEQLNDYLNWRVDDSSNAFAKLKEEINWTAIARKWKYDFANPEEIATSQPESNQDKENQDNSNDNNKKRKNGENTDLPEPKRAKVEETEKEVQQEITENDEATVNKLTNALSGLSSQGDDEEKKKKLGEIEKLKNEGKAYEEQKTAIKEKKDELAASDPQGYGKMVATVIQQKIKEFKVEIANLGQGIIEKLTKLQNGEFTNDAKVREVEEEVSEKVSEEVAKVEVNGLLTQAQNLLNGVAGNLKSQLEKIKKDLYSLKFSTNVYQQKAYQLEKPKVEKALKDLESFQNNTTQPTKSGFFRPEVMVPLALVIVLVAAIATVVVIRRRKQLKLKK